MASALVAGMFACVIAMLLAGPGLRSKAACHTAPAGNHAAVASVGQHGGDGHAPHEANQEAVHGHAHGHGPGVDAGHAPPGPGQGEPVTPEQCCVVAVGSVLTASMVVIGPAAMDGAPLRAPKSLQHDGIDPAAPRKPPRTTDIADLAA